MSLNPYRTGSQRHDITKLLLEGRTREDIFRAIYPLVLAQTEPFVFSDNVDGSRVAKDIYSQIPLLFYAIGNVRNDLLRKRPDAAGMLASESSFDARNFGSKAWRASLYRRIREEYENNSEPVISEPVSEPVASAPDSVREKVNYLVRRLYDIRRIVKGKAVNNREFAFISTRAFVHGTDAVIAGIEPEDFLVSIGMAWNPETRRECGIKDSVDFARYAIPDTPLPFGFILRMVDAKIPVYLYGPTGSGKSTIARMIADYKGLEYGEIPLSCGVSRTDLFGNWNASGFVGRPLLDLYPNGGVFCLEEIDAADPNILLAINNLIANSHLFNTSNGETLARHEDFVPIATANTLGNGATSNHGAREGLDAATLDRFRYGMVHVDYSVDVEMSIVESKLAAGNY